VFYFLWEGKGKTGQISLLHFHQWNEDKLEPFEFWSKKNQIALLAAPLCSNFHSAPLLCGGFSVIYFPIFKKVLFMITLGCLLILLPFCSGLLWVPPSWFRLLLKQGKVFRLLLSLSRERSESQENRRKLLWGMWTVVLRFFPFSLKYHFSFFQKLKIGFPSFLPCCRRRSRKFISLRRKQKDQVIKISTRPPHKDWFPGNFRYQLYVPPYFPFPCSECGDADASLPDLRLFR